MLTAFANRNVRTQGQELEIVPISAFPSCDENSCHRSPLVPVLPARGYIDPVLDRRISELARAARPEDAAMRNALFAAYRPRLQRICDRLWYRWIQDTECEREDLNQEIFIVFAALLEKWSGNGSFSAYVHGALPWRLRDAATRLRPANLPVAGRESLLQTTDHEYAAAEALLLLDEIAAALAPFERQLLLRRVRDGQSLSASARELGVSHRTAKRAWARLQLTLRNDLDPNRQ